MIDISAVSNFLKKVIAPTIESQLPGQTIILSQIKEKAGVTKMDNDAFYVTLRSGRHSGLTWNASTETNIPTQGKDKYSQTKVDAKYGYGAFRIDHKVMAVSDKGTIRSITKAETEGLLEDLTIHMNRQALGYGNGQLCLANGAGSATTTLTVDTPGTDPFLSEGMSIIIGSGAAVRIATIDSETQATLESARTWSDNDIVKLATPDGTAASEMMGMKGFADDGTLVATLQNIARASNHWWKTPAASLSTGAAVLAESIMNGIYLSARKNGSKGRKSRYAWLLATNMYQKYGELLTSMKRSATSKEVLNGSWKGLEFMDGIPVMDEPHALDGEGFLVDFDAVGWAKLAPLGFLDGANGVFDRVPGTTWYEAVAFVYGNYYTNRPRALGRFSGKTTS